MVENVIIHRLEIGINEEYFIGQIKLYKRINIDIDIDNQYCEIWLLYMRTTVVDSGIYEGHMCDK